MFRTSRSVAVASIYAFGGGGFGGGGRVLYAVSFLVSSITGAPLLFYAARVYTLARTIHTPPSFRRLRFRSFEKIVFASVRGFLTFARPRTSRQSVNSSGALSSRYRRVCVTVNAFYVAAVRPKVSVLLLPVRRAVPTAKVKNDDL